MSKLFTESVYLMTFRVNELSTDYYIDSFQFQLNKSTYNRVVLKDVQPEVSGRYKCEVSSDAPNFYTFMVSGYMFVIDIPEGDPVVTVEKELLEIGSIIRGNCSSPASYPPANVTWFLNGKEVNTAHIRRSQRPSVSSKSVTTTSSNRRSPTITVANIEVEVDENTFREGKARLRCAVNILDLYKKSREVVLEEDGPRPMLSLVLGTPVVESGSPDIFNSNIFLFSCIIVFLR
ncbi:unnamed protein product [Phaedon cochleariae]|uniref:Ig-like domain-containing protein n=1 Tax=Phaedon cochleariae TaxID=80249 RepID=A0A9P0DY21_PHACE|nr:unnamed protein product [Phaedon cochleariae]